MASRRLAISSLLCDDEDASNKPESRGGRPVESPTSSHQRAARPYASPVRSAFHPVRSPSPNPSILHSARYEQQYHRHVYEPSPSPPGPVPYIPSRSDSPLPLPLALQPVALQRRTPSPPPMSVSPEPFVANHYERHYMDEGPMSNPVHYRDSSDFPSRHSGPSQQRHSNMAHSPSYLQYELPVSPSSPLSIQRPAQQNRRAVLQISSFDQARTHSQITNSPPAGRTHFPPQSPEMTTISPSHSFDGSRTRHPISYGETEQRNASYPQQNNFPTYRYSASVSPTIPKSAGISGLDVLSQAATEVRERIDESRRVSGGGETRFSPEVSRSSEAVSEVREYSHGRARGVEERSRESIMAPQQAYSPPAFRSDVQLQPTSPKPSPRSAPVIPSYASSGRTSPPIEREFSNYSPPRALKRRLSPESDMGDTGMHPAETAQGARPRPSTQPNVTSRALARVVSDPEKFTSNQAEISQHAFEFQVPPVDVVQKPEASQIALQSQVVHKVEARHANDPKPSPNVRIPTGTGPPSRPPVALAGRRSPPRSRPKPKKPGSAALATMEQASVPPAAKPIESEHAIVVKPGPGSSRSIQAAPKSKKAASNKPTSATIEKQEEDEESTKFFLSAVSSLKGSQQSKTSTPEVIPSSSQLKQPVPQHRKPWVKPARDSPLRIEIRRSPASDILDGIIDSPDVDEEASSHTAYNNQRISAYMDDIDNELANAVDATPSADEGEARPTFSENDEPVSDAMEVDVDNELLSLLDDPSEATPRQINQVHKIKETSASHILPASLGRASMPPPDVPNVKSGKKDTSKAKGKAKAHSDAVPGTSKASTQQPSEEVVDKV